jgi:signal transduction histidine kinase
MSSRGSGLSSFFLVAALVVVLGLLAALQFRWTGELSRAERDRLQRGAAEATRRLAAEFDSEIAALGSRLAADPVEGETRQEQVSREMREMPRDSARLVGEVWIVRLEPGDLEASRFDASSGRWDVAEPPAWFPAPGRGLRMRRLLPDVPAIVLPFGQPHGMGGTQFRGPRGQDAGPDGAVIVLLERRALSAEFLPELVARHFGGDDVRAWSVAVIDRSSRTVVYSSDVEMPAVRPDFEAPLWGLARAPLPEASARGGRGQSAATEGAWVVQVRRIEGTLEETIARSRARNLALSGGVLLLLLAGGLMTIANAHRSRELARQQLEFVTTVTHELNTPIAAVSSAGQNLADGVVKDPDHVRRYGAMIAREGRRLSTMVEQVLELAGVQRSAFALSKTESTVGEVIDRALASTAWLVEENGVRIERDVPDAARRIECDVDALARALSNLVSNAVKYRGTSSRVVVSARIDEEHRELGLSVADEGLGLSPEDAKRIFEPFVRGANATDRAIRGSGLGLAIVRRIAEAHGGRVTVVSTPGRGSTFTIRIPVSR